MNYNISTVKYLKIPPSKFKELIETNPTDVNKLLFSIDLLYIETLIKAGYYHLCAIETYLFGIKEEMLKDMYQRENEDTRASAQLYPSMTVGDVLVLSIKGEVSYHVCTIDGFKDLSVEDREFEPYSLDL